MIENTKTSAPKVGLLSSRLFAAALGSYPWAYARLCY